MTRQACGDTARPRFAFLLLEEHPYGREMLAHVLDNGFAPTVIVEERSAVADQERAKFEQRIAGHPVAPSVAAQAASSCVPLVRVDAHTSEVLVPKLAPLDLDLIVLGGTRILRGALLDLPRDGVINSHPGLLPECRGSASPAWSVYHDLPIGATTHFCDAGIDTGDILLRHELPVRRGDSYEDLCHATLVLAGKLMAEALVAYSDGRWPVLRRAQGTSAWPTFRNAPEDVLEVVREKLRAHTYAHYVD